MLKRKRQDGSRTVKTGRMQTTFVDPLPPGLMDRALPLNIDIRDLLRSLRYAYPDKVFAVTLLEGRHYLMRLGAKIVCDAPTDEHNTPAVSDDWRIVFNPSPESDSDA